ncbi:MAG: glycosyltransferase [Cyclobacteriaceae bacterium]
MQSKILTHGDVAKVLTQHFNFVEIKQAQYLKGQTSRKQKLMAMVSDFFFVLRHTKAISGAEVLIGVGYVAIPIRILIWLNLIRCQRFVWVGFLIQNASLFNHYRRFIHLVPLPQQTFVLNAESDILRYSRKLQLPPSYFTYLPVVDTQEVAHQPGFSPVESNSYYFAGGYSNRDYQPLIDAFRTIPHRLIVVGSHVNQELHQISDLPDHITVKQDIPKAEFEALVRGAKACILPLKEEVGASGQRVMNSYMRNGKLIIAADMQITRQYLQEGANGYLYKNAVTDLPAIIQEIEETPEKRVLMKRNAYAFYQQNLTLPALLQSIEKNLLHRIQPHSEITARQ